jgi:peptidoglycan/LPS O-acetylase OafA/YrhL
MMDHPPELPASGQIPTPFRPHIPALDGIRGLAVLLVMAEHLLWSNLRTGNRFFDFVNAIRSATWTGVDLFFVLSGFLITGILYDSLCSGHYFRNFYARRVLRIFPLYYGFLLLLICLTYPLKLQWHGTQFILLSYTQNLGVYSFRPAGFINLNHFWSLAVEEQFYLVWPCIVFLVRDARKLIIIALALSASALILRLVMRAVGAPVDEVFAFTGCRADSLMIGGVLALTLRTRFQQSLLRYSSTAFFVLFAVLISAGLYLGSLDYRNAAVQGVGYTIIAAMYAALIATVIARPTFTRFVFENGFMRFFGKYSYGLYVFHYSLDAALTQLLRRKFNETFHSKAISVMLSAFIVTILAVIVAFASYHLYEKHFLKLKKHFEPRGARERPESLKAIV